MNDILITNFTWLENVQIKLMSEKKTKENYFGVSLIAFICSYNSIPEMNRTWIDIILFKNWQRWPWRLRYNLDDIEEEKNLLNANETFENRRFT